jgi:hypothetical protein
MLRTVSVLVGLLLIACATCLSQDALPTSSDRVPVLVELFTSEGCSSCPPADRFVQLLDTQPIPGIEIIVLSEHVDYWNHQGWNDPYSSPEFTERQRTYGRQFDLPDVYTPQLVVDGCRQMSGSNAKEAEVALREAKTQHKTDLRITHVAVDRDRLRIHVESATFQQPDLRSADVYIVTALDHAESQVMRGENANRHLTHTAVLRKIQRIRKLSTGERFSQDVELKIDGKTDRRNLRVIAFLQDPKSRKVLGAAMTRVDGSQAASASNTSAVRSR